MPRISKVYQLSEDEFRQLIATHQSLSACARVLGMSTAGGNSYRQLRKRINELQCDITHFEAPTTIARRNLIKHNLDDIMVENSTYTHTTRLKDRLIKEKLLIYKCAICGNEGQWNNQPLVLQLDHINGNHSDNRLENLRLLCPNCHSQTETFCGKNLKD